MTATTITTNGWTGFLGKGLAPRELEATLLAASDLTFKQIAKLMGVAPITVEKRLESARFKLGVRTARGLVIECMKRQIITPMVIMLCMILTAQQANTEQFGRIRRPGERRAEVRLTVRRAETFAIA